MTRRSYPALLDDNSLDLYLTHLTLRMRQKLKSRNRFSDIKSLDERERKAYDIQYQKVITLLRQKPKDEQEQGYATLKQANKELGAQGMLDSLTLPPMIMGMHYPGLLIGGLICGIIFALTHHSVILFFAVPIITSVLSLYFMLRLKKERDQNIEKIIQGY